MASLNLVVDFDFIEEARKKEHQNIWNGMELLIIGHTHMVTP